METMPIEIKSKFLPISSLFRCSGGGGFHRLGGLLMPSKMPNFRPNAKTLPADEPGGQPGVR